MKGSRLQELIERIANLLRAQERQIGADSGLQPVHLQVLTYLLRCNRYSDSPAAVTEFLGLTKGTVSQSLRVLEDRKFIGKNADADDGRKLHLFLTHSGKRLARKVSPLPLLKLAEQQTKQSGSLEKGLEELLRGIQLQSGSRAFGVCHTCTHFVQKDSGRFVCGLTSEPLSLTETDKICREHEYSV